MPPAPDFLDLVTVHGPWLLFLLAIAETSFITGLMVPSGVATSVATAFALEEGSGLLPVAAAAVLGGAIGDHIGFFIGRKARDRWLDGSDRVSARARRIRADAGRFFGRHPFYSVTVARLISFVRTVMPMAAGSSSLPYPRFLPYEFLGVLAWSGTYMAMGAAAEEGIDWAQRLAGPYGALMFAAGALGIWWVTRRAFRRAKGRGARSG